MKSNYYLFILVLVIITGFKPYPKTRSVQTLEENWQFRNAEVSGAEFPGKEVHTAGKPHHLALSADRKTISADGKDLLFEAGTRVPFMAYWKGKIEPTVSDGLFSQLDLFSSLAKLAGSETHTTDSQELLDVLLGKSQQGREELILEASSRTALRKGDWVMIPPYKGAAVQTQVNIELGNSREFQLYNLKEDIEMDF